MLQFSRQRYSSLISQVRQRDQYQTQHSIATADMS